VYIGGLLLFSTLLTFSVAKQLPQYNMSARNAGRRDELMRKAKRGVENSTCFYPGCSYKAIGSHVLQENGVLNQIAENGHIMEFAPLGLFQPSRFEPAGIGATNRLRFYGFCKEGADHDGEVFASIENDKCNFLDYREQLLTSYRALCNNFYQIKYLISYENKMNAKGARAKNIYAYKELEHLKDKMESELFLGPRQPGFTFHRYILPKLDLAACHIFSPAFRPLLTYEQALDLDPYSNDYQSVYPVFFINLIPRSDKLIVIIGHINGIHGVVEGLPINRLAMLSEGHVIKFISDIFVRRIDTWAMSISLYERLKFQDKISQFLKFRSDYFPYPRQRSFFYPYSKFGPLEMPYELSQALRQANRWELWKFKVPFNLFDAIL
jgi:hypothetical protein